MIYTHDFKIRKEQVGEAYLFYVGRQVFKIDRYFDDQYYYFNLGSGYGIDPYKKFLKVEKAEQYLRKCLANWVNTML